MQGSVYQRSRQHDVACTCVCKMSFKQGTLRQFQQNNADEIFNSSLSEIQLA